jgi:hypothetical protein
LHSSLCAAPRRNPETAMKYRACATLAATALFAAAGAVCARPALACGGFFCSQQQPVNQAAERIIFADNGDGTVTAVIQILYQGPSESRHSWHRRSVRAMACRGQRPASQPPRAHPGHLG